ncbi:MAG: DsrE/DsrF/DrsH-like family protein [Desulfatiglans sp.]|jgi:peroxiredoxin family protein|nr:DsrE/DsrF/DrsH-like family protein [Thermodesulfobacteriota bacterium]MEE4354276.1 DsrE/DsrF/DrsH-like family protein [Desulfatiglans sp.]
MGEDKEKTAFICSRDSLDGAYPPLILATNAVRQGMESKVFFTFMGMNLLLKGGLDKSKFIPSGVMGAIPGMSTMATSMMKKKMDKANIPSLSELQEMAEIEGVGFVACHMTMEMMELSSEDLIEGVSIWTAEDFIKYARQCKISLFT